MSCIRSWRDVQAFAQAFKPALNAVLPHVCGVTHVTATFDDGSACHNIVLGDHAPKSAEDTLVLSLMRAASCAVLTSGRTLSIEGGHALTPMQPHRAAVEDWIRKIRGHEPGPRLGAILTRGFCIDPHWSVFKDSRYEAQVYTTHDGAARVAQLFHDSSSPRTPAILSPLRNATAWTVEEVLRDLSRKCERDVRTGRCSPIIGVECGPSITHPLYETQDGHARHDTPVEYLMLSRYRGGIDSRAVGDRVLSHRTLNGVFEQLTAATFAGQASGSSWTFSLLRRRGPAGHAGTRNL